MSDVHTFRLRMQTYPALETTLLALRDPPEAFEAATGINVDVMRSDLLGTLTEAEAEGYQQYTDAPPRDGDAPTFPVALDKPEALALAGIAHAVWVTTDGPVDRVVLEAIADFFPKIPQAWVDEMDGPIADSIEATRRHVEGDDG